MKKRIISVLLILILIIGVLPGLALAADGLSNFVKVATYQSGRFSDVSSTKWYAPSVQTAYEYGLISGKPSGTFDPDSNITIAETVKLAACLHSIYNTGSTNFGSASPWYKPYSEYALKSGIIASDLNYNAPATRAEFAVILAKALPEAALAVKNSVADNAIPDVPSGSSYSPAVYALYRAGILVGCNKTGLFQPESYIKRAEVAAVVTRMANVSFRQSVNLSLNLTTEQIFSKCSPAVFFIEIYDIKGTEIKTGSGFFIDSSGTAVTNYHVISGAAKAVITTSDGKQYNVSGVYDYDGDKDLALIKVDGSNFSYLDMADSDTVVTGANVYAIGSPLGYKNSLSKGIISSASRLIEGHTYIQTTAAISSGSSGGALIDETGKVIGVTTATAVGAQNINLAKPINLIRDFKKTNLVTLESILPATVYYENHYPVPDFGALTSTPIYQTETLGDTATYYYKLSDLPGTIESAFDGYAALLEQNTFSFYGYAIEDGRIISYYLNGAYAFLVTFGLKDYNGTECIRVQIMGM